MFSNTQRIAGVEREKKPETKPTQSENHRNRKANMYSQTNRSMENGVEMD